ncbi:MAG: dienelactone hydrolase family protein [Crocinitomicaceae bacterium]|nr:dienelactone hydrolase family protein [Crocinitomicaceae bacterium]MBP6032335.1 dienelactone hydrolase family protein [Crocinitomicaceae bacterium]
MRIGILLSVLFLSLSSYGQLKAIHNQADYPFLLHLPADSILKNNPPVLIFLHGRSLSGNNLEMVKKYGIIHEIEKGREIPAIVLAPQVPAGKSWEPEKVLSVLRFAQEHFQTDTNRVYVTGMSLGAYGTLDFAGEYPEIVTAAVALCGGGNTRNGCNLSTIPVWIQHGNRDSAVPISESEKMVRSIRACNGGENLKYTVVPGANHGDLERVFRTDELYDWLFQFSKDPQK